MDNTKSKSYAPNERGFFDQNPQKIKAYSAEDYTELPDPVTDPIASNNIASQEFDYTYSDDDAINLDDSQNRKTDTKQVNKEKK